MPNVLEYDQLKQILPQSYPFALLDRVTDYTPGESLTAVKNITANEWCFADSSQSGMEIFPETLLIEAAAQAALVLYQVSKAEAKRSSRRFVLGKVMADFAGQAKVGDTVSLTVKAGKMMDDKGFSNAVISSGPEAIGNVEVFYGVLK